MWGVLQLTTLLVRRLHATSRKWCSRRCTRTLHLTPIPALSDLHKSLWLRRRLPKSQHKTKRCKGDHRWTAACEIDDEHLHIVAWMPLAVFAMTGGNPATQCNCACAENLITLGHIMVAPRFLERSGGKVPLHRYRIAPRLFVTTLTL